MNSLSFSSYTGTSLSDLIGNAVVQLGFPKEQLGKLDSQSTLSISLHELPDIMISIKDDRLWIWSLLPKLVNSKLHAMASPILEILMTPIENIEGGFLSLCHGEVEFELSGLVKLDCLSSETGLSELLNSFREHLNALCQTLDIQGE